VTNRQTEEALSFDRAHASPSVRRIAREQGIDLNSIQGSGPKGRITKADLSAGATAAPASPAPISAAVQPGSGIPPIPEQDFARFGEVELQPLSKIKRLTGINLSRAWLNVPHVTHQDETDITEVEEFRKSLKAEAERTGLRVTLLSFFMKACAATLKAYPTFNASLDGSGENLILKRYIHIGIAVDTPNGLVVPVIRDVDQKSIFELSAELAEMSLKAREKRLKPLDMQGGTFTISSLGGIGGTAFTPIVNAPEVAILGLTRSQMKPVWNGSAFVPRLMQPMSLSYDHRVIDGAQAAHFVRHLGTLMNDVRRLLL
jgi:pyruvate dehydrogenase E2 component (dihydrolipoamide acetyltransferase)